MSGSNLTRVDAMVRAELLDVQSYDVNLDLTDGAGQPGEHTFRSRTEVRFVCRQPGSETFIDFLAAKIHEATLNGAPIDLSDYQPDRGIRLTKLATENVLIVEADCHFMNTGEGLHRFVDPSDGEVYLFSQFETRDALRVFACFDQPDLKAQFTFHVTTPSRWRVFSNTSIAATEQGPAGSATHHFAQTVLVPTYITAIVAGPYQGSTDEHDGIPLGVYCRRSLHQYLEPEEIFTITKQGLDHFHKNFGFRYPFEKYDQIFVPEFNAGAMENAACVTFADDYLIFRSKQTRLMYEQRSETILHEMAHMWFGDLVTMKWWNDLWLNESFAEWAGYWATAEATQYRDAWTSFCTIRKAWGMRQDQLSSTHPVAADAPDVATAETNFDGITYAKGAAILKQLVAYVGQEAFLIGLRNYFQKHAYGNATLADLLNAVAESSGRDMTDWAQAWLQTTSVNTLRPIVSTAEARNYSSFDIQQDAPKDHPTLRPHRLAIGLYDPNEAGELVRRDRIEIDITGSHTSVLALVGVKQPALLLVNDDDLTYAKIRLDQRSMQTAVDQIDRLNDPLARALCWSAAWDMNRDAELPTKQYAHMTVRGLPRETKTGVIQAELSHSINALERYADPAWAPTGFRQLAQAAWQTAQAAEPGSDLQLIWVRTLISAARDQEHLAIITALLHADPTVLAQLPQLALDVELRWQLLQACVCRSAAGETEIAAEQQRDATDQGARMAAMARAMIPTPEAKATAWRMTVEDTSVPNQKALSIMRGFTVPEHAALLKPYVNRYFEVIADVWQQRTTEVARNIAEWLYPSWEITEQTVSQSDEYLAANPQLPAALRRRIAEGRDGVTRALKAQACDRAAD